MNLEIFEKYSRERLDLIRTFNFIQYESDFVDYGNFTIKIPIDEKSLTYIKRDNYILFEDGILGIIKYVNKETEESSEVTVKGFLSNYFLTYRSFLKTKKYTGKRNEIVRSMVSDLFIDSENVKRNIDFISLSEDSKYNPVLQSITVQNTGNSLNEVSSEILKAENCGFNLYPNISKYDKSLDKQTNISSFEFRILKSKDRTIGNEEGNNPVVFSMSMNNLSSSIYTEDATEFCTTAIVAGEGEGQERTIVEVGDLEASSIDRIELYIDARDLQKQDSEGNVFTEEEYCDMLKQRGIEKLSEHNIFLNFDGTVIASKTSFVFGEDYNLGDFVTVLDEELDLQFNLQITKVVKSVDSSGEILDLVFGDEKMSMQKIIKRRKN